MRWFTNHLRNIGIASVSVLFLLTCLALIPLSEASAYEETSRGATLIFPRNHPLENRKTPNFDRHNTSLRIIERVPTCSDHGSEQVGRRLPLGGKGLLALDLRHTAIDCEIHAGDI